MMYKVRIDHYSDGVMYKSGDVIKDAPRLDQKLKSGLVVEIKTVEPEIQKDAKPKRKPAKRARKTVE